jgi:hypothetical protein
VSFLRSSRECPVCGARDASPCLRIAEVPVACNVLHDTREAARAAKRGRFELLFCPRCEHLFNGAFDEELLEYTERYENSQHYSPAFRDYAHALARSLSERHGLRGKTIVEVACGKGDFLALLCELGGNRGLGFDPSYDASRGGVAHGWIEVRAELFAARCVEAPPDFVCCRHALEHIARPGALLDAVREAAFGARVPVYFEVPNATYMLEERAVWDLIYEHCGYFTETSLARLFTRHGYDVDEVGASFGSQFLQIHASTGGGGPEGGGPSGRLEGQVEAFQRDFDATRAEWAERLARYRRRGMRIALWGAGSKGVTFSSLCADDAVACIVDVNPHKVGRFVPGSGHEVVAPDALRDLRPDVVVVMNPIYRDEIAGTLRALGLGCEIVIARAAGTTTSS